MSLYNEKVNVIRLDILMDFIELGKKEGAIGAAISTQTIMEFINAITEMQLSWEENSNFKEKALELYHLILFGLIGR